MGKALCQENYGPFWELNKGQCGWDVGHVAGDIGMGKATGGLDGHSKDLGFCPKSNGKSWKCCVLCTEMLTSDM